MLHCDNKIYAANLKYRAYIVTCIHSLLQQYFPTFVLQEYRRSAQSKEQSHLSTYEEHSKVEEHVLGCSMHQYSEYMTASLCYK